ncbi:mechanosensitive ion channel family protein [Siphonobacter sp. SORGH_AS_1065]|uniref:mechanosensitive ion channel family protein n=1 Tax=Siphonobacter sp. SORGH_AS_1065 TaxID=3041795 RepID=UPI00278588BF|nr:mechanosensitive ion channel domain-containing protein [Siphonobacter sp. SORGH_AS_1065]MDQ1089235.1 small conductance mechanosensitive channel [Siphonobacter sp. SORGH_AS_1065]
MDLENAKNVALLAISQYGGKVLLALATFLIGRFIIGKLIRFLSSRMNQSKIDRDVQPFLSSMINVLLNVMLLLSCAGILGIETTSFVAILGTASLAVGLALQGSLANFAGGVLILIFKPFRVGDLIEAQGFTGVVEAIQIFNTILVTPDNKTIIIPNGPLSTSPLTNISGKGIIRVDMVFGVGSQNTLEATKSAIQKAVDACPHALKDRPHDVLLTKLQPDSATYDVRVWTTPAHYWDTYYFMQEQIKRQFDQDGIQAAQKVIYIKQ